MTTEKYYAVRIGSPNRHKVYFMVGDGRTPALFTTAAAAEQARPKNGDTKVVPVWVTDRESK